MTKYTPVSGIYVILNTKNGKVYIGQTQDFRCRWNEHKRKLNGNFHSNNHLQAAWDKYGSKSFKFQKLEYCPIEQLDEREQHYLDIYMTKGICYNIAIDAKAPTRGMVFSEDTKLKMSISQKKRPPKSQETRRKLSIANKGKELSEKTKQKLRDARKIQAPMSDEAHRKMSDFQKKKTVSQIIRQKISKGLKGHPVSEETRQKLSDIFKGRVSNRKGKTVSEEARKRMSESRKLYLARKHAEREKSDSE